MASRLLHLLRSKAGLWDYLAHAACMATGQPESQRMVGEAGGAGQDEDDSAVVEAAWRLKAQSLAIRILVLNSHLPGTNASPRRPQSAALNSTKFLVGLAQCLHACYGHRPASYGVA